MAGPRVRVVIVMGMEFGMVKVWMFSRDYMGGDAIAAISVLEIPLLCGEPAFLLPWYQTF